MKRKTIAYVLQFIFMLLAGILNLVIYHYGNTYDFGYDFTNFAFFMIMLLIPMLGKIIFGISIGSDHLLKLKIIDKVRVKVNIHKLILLGIPTLFISLIKIFYFYGIVPFIYMDNEILSISTLFQIFLGYIIISSIEKKDTTK